MDYYNAVEKLIPTEDLSINTPIFTILDLRSQSETRIKQRVGNIRLFLYDGDQIIGSSGTYYTENKEIKAIGTGLTAVREDYHKQGIATYLKIKMILHFLDDFPHFTYIDTENAQSNQAMLAINKNLGFGKVYSWIEHEVQISVLEKIFEK